MTSHQRQNYISIIFSIIAALSLLWIITLEKTNVSPTQEKLIIAAKSPEPKKETPQIDTILLPAPPQITSAAQTVSQPITSAAPEKVIPLKPSEQVPNAITLKKVLTPKTDPIVPEKAITVLKPTPQSPAEIASNPKFNKTEPQPKPTKVSPQIAENTAAPTQDLKDGRSLLRLLEHGKGPSIEIAWPASINERTKMFELFSNCFGMQVALMDAKGQLFNIDGPSGQAWQISLDRFSGFVRQSGQSLTPHESAIISQVKQLHNAQSTAAAVRIFPRRVDASLLGGLKRIAQSYYEQAHIIRAQYEITSDQIMVSHIIIDDRIIPGNFKLAPLNGSCHSRRKA